MPRQFSSILLLVASFTASAFDVQAQGTERFESLGADSVVEGARFERDTDLASSGRVLLVCSPLKMPKITSRFGMRRHPVTGKRNFHNGADLSSSDPLVMSVYQGEVVEVSEHPNLGMFIRIDHGDVYSIYGHLSASLVEAGDRVSAGQAIGIMGQTGRATGIHLHFSIRIDHRYVDPIRFLFCLQEKSKNN